MTTPGGVSNLPTDALTLDSLASKTQDMTAAAMRGRAGAHVATIFGGSTGGNPLSDLTPFGIITRIWTEVNSAIANADPADINGPEDIPDLLLQFIEGLPVIGQLVGLLEAILGTYDGDDPILLDLQKFFGLFRDLFDLVDLDLDDLPTLDEVWGLVITNFIKPLGDFVSLVGGLLNAAWIPGLDGSKIISGTIAQTFLNIVSIPGSIIAGLLSGANIPILDQTKVSGLNIIANNASTAQGNWTSFLSGGSWPDISASVADFLGTKSTANTAAADATNALSDASGAQSTATTAQSTALQTITSLFNKLSGNNASSASQAQLAQAAQAIVNTIGAQGAAINALQNLMEGANGFSSSVAFRQPETTVFDVAGNYTPVLPTWFNHATDSVDEVGVGAGGGGGGGLSDSSGAGTDTVFRVAGVTKATGVGGASVGSGTGSHPNGYSPGNQLYLDILYSGGGEAAVKRPGSPPGGGGGAGEWFGIQGKGGNAGTWDAVTLGPGQATGALSLTVGAGGAGTASGFGAADGADGCGWVRARPGMPAAFTSMGNFPGTSIPMYRLNTGVALTDAMTAAATWARTPPGGASGGHILIVRANASFTTLVYLWVKTVGGQTNYELGRVSSGVKSTWKTGSISEAVPFNAFSVTSDDGYIYTIAVNGTPFDSYNDTTHSSLLGASYRSGGWASSDSALPGSIIQFAFLDSGTPSIITSNTIATSQGTSSAAYVDLATVGPSVTITVPQSGRVVVDISAEMATTALTSQTGFMGIAVSGANTIAAADTRCARGTWAGSGGLGGTISNRFLYENLAAGTTTFKAVFKSSSGTVNFANRNLIAEPKP